MSLRHLPVAEVLRLGVPLALAASGHALRLFIDRLMLAWNSADSVSASLPGGLTAFLGMTFFLGCAGYSQVLAAHYLGAGEPRRIGACLWQGLWIALVGGLVMALAAPWAPAAFAALGHAPRLSEAEGRYCAILLGGGVFGLLSAVLSGFWAARGHTALVMVVSLAQAGLNALLNLPLIFGHWGFPALGIDGAGWATVIAEAAGAGFYLVLFLAPHHRRDFLTWPRRTLEPALMRRLLRYGLPQGLQLFLDIAAFNAFVLIMAAYPAASVAEATSLAFGVNGVAFIPMLRIGRAASILVGHAQGARDPDGAHRAVLAASLVVVAYCLVLGAWFALAPDSILAWYVRPGDASQAEALALAHTFLLFVAVWLFFDGLWQLLIQALQGAGDSRWTMIAMTLLSWLVQVPVTWLAWYLGAPPWLLFAWLVAFIILGVSVFAWRWLDGAWRHHDVLGRGDPSVAGGTASAA